MMEWDDSYTVGVESLDEQHKRIIDMINELHESLILAEDSRRLDELLVRLAIYTVKHFIYEEHLFKKYGYEFQEEHKIEHDLLSQCITEFQKKHLVEGIDMEEDLLVFFKHQLIKHILTYDSKYMAFMSDHGVK